MTTEFEKTINIALPRNNGKNMQQWIFTLPEEEQKEWDRVAQLHQSIVQKAIAAGDAKYEDKKILWKSDAIHNTYFDSILNDHRIYLDYWQRYRETLK